MERRRIVYQDGSYQILKPKNNGNFFPYGEKKSLKAISDLLRTEKFALDMPEEIVCDVNQYRKRREERRKEYFSKKGVESKTI